VTLANIATSLTGHSGGVREASLPLGCLYLASALERTGIKVDVRDYQLFNPDSFSLLDVERMESFLVDSAPIVGISCMISMLPFATLGTRRFKQSHPDRTVILGGAGPSGVAHAIVSSMPWIDVVGRGEGEATIVELIRALKNGRDIAAIRGITYRSGLQVYHNAPRHRIRDLDEILPPAYEKVNVADYTDISVITARGCPLGCAFCDVGPLWGNQTLFRSVDRVIEEIALLKNAYGRRTIHILDDTLNLLRGRTEEFCEKIEGLGINWSCSLRVDLLDEALLERMARAGCNSIFLGIESGSDAVLRRINKNFTVKEATHKVSLATEHIKEVTTSFIWGFPFETMDDFKATMHSVVSVWRLGAQAGLRLLSPMPLSRLGAEYRDHLEFSEDLCSAFASLGNIAPWRPTYRPELPDEFKEVIRTYPEVFMGFCHIKSNTIREKLQYLNEFCEKRGILI